MRAALVGLFLAPLVISAQVGPDRPPPGFGVAVNGFERGSIITAPPPVRLLAVPEGELVVRLGARRGDGVRGILLVLTRPDPTGALRSDSLELNASEAAALQDAIRRRGSPPAAAMVEHPGERLRLRVGWTTLEFDPATTQRLLDALWAQTTWGRAAARSGSDIVVGLTLQPESADSAFARTGRPPERQTYVDGIAAMSLAERGRTIAARDGELAIVPGPRELRSGQRGVLLIATRFDRNGPSTVDTLVGGTGELAALGAALEGGGAPPAGIVVTEIPEGRRLAFGRVAVTLDAAAMTRLREVLPARMEGLK